MFRRRLGALLMCGLSVSILVSCSLVGREGGSADRGDLADAGFTNIAGLELLEAHWQAGIDYSVDFVLRGSPEAIDRALASASFIAAPRPGVRTTRGFTDGFGPEDFGQPVTAYDHWTNPDGEQIYRTYVRGTTPQGDDILQVWAAL
jgi:hypothetical protein